ncbi:MAG: HNH endonuclease signature motif containing protein, partial [Kofleriaceae bacterium]
GCRFPGCSNRLFVEGHHVEHWADGGETKLTNLVSMCSHHHRFVHEYGYRIELRDSEVVFRDPRGRIVEPAPCPESPDGRGWETIHHRNANLAIDEHTIACEWDGQRLNLIGCVDELVRAEARGRRGGSGNG